MGERFLEGSGGATIGVHTPSLPGMSTDGLGPVPPETLPGMSCDAEALDPSGTVSASVSWVWILIPPDFVTMCPPWSCPEVHRLIRQLRGLPILTTARYLHVIYLLVLGGQHEVPLPCLVHWWLCLGMPWSSGESSHHRPHAPALPYGPPRLHNKHRAPATILVFMRAQAIGHLTATCHIVGPG